MNAAYSTPPRSQKDKDLTDPRVLDAAVFVAHRQLRSLFANRFSSLRKSFRTIDKDGSGSCDRSELKSMLASAFSLNVPEIVMDKFIDKADADGNGNISFVEFARVFAADDVHNMEQTAVFVDQRAPLDPMRPMQVRAHHSHFPAGHIVPVNDCLSLETRGARFIPRVLTSSHGRASNFAGHASPPREKFLGRGTEPRGRRKQRSRLDVASMHAAGKSLGKHVPFRLDWPIDDAADKKGQLHSPPQQQAPSSSAGGGLLPPLHVGGATAIAMAVE